MTAKALYVIALIATFQFTLGDYCFSLPNNESYIINPKTDSLCLIAANKPADDPPTNNYSYPLVAATYTTVSGTPSTASINIQKGLSYVIKG